ncbi:MAG: DUF4293 domain-containing protein [Bacteroidales bacterium]|nr:DUF4293 domain-containing protein [Bacteroidales bacterium]
MWQRIQTLYLLIASGLLVAMYFHQYPTGHIVLFSIALAAQLLAIVALKSRTLQMRLSNLAALVLLGLQVWIVVAWFKSETPVSIGFTDIFPVVATILDFLAARAILKDELLVRSASRLRAAKHK